MIINSTFNVLTTELAKTLIRQDEGGNKVLKNRDTDVLKHRRVFQCLFMYITAGTCLYALICSLLNLHFFV